MIHFAKIYLSQAFFSLFSFFAF